MNFIGFILTIGLFIVVVAILISVIKYAIDSSKTSEKLDLLLDEIRMLRRELKNQDQDNRNEHMIDKRL